MKIEILKIKEITPYKNNPKNHPKKQIDKIKNSINEFGFNLPLLIDKKNRIIAGHGRYIAIKEMKITKIPCIRIEHLSKKQIRAYRIADNKVAESDWLSDKLQIELIKLDKDNYDLEFTGFDTNEINDIFEDINKTNNENKQDDIPDIKRKPKSKFGQIWQLGQHRLLCGDAKNKKDIEKLMDGEIAKMVFIDPPYGVNYQGIRTKREKIINDNLKENEFKDLLFKSFYNLYNYTIDGGGIYVCFSNKNFKLFNNALTDSGWKISQTLIWLKNQFVLGRSDYHHCYEPIFYGWKPTKKRYWYGARKQYDAIDLKENLTINSKQKSKILVFKVGAQSVVLEVPEYKIIYSGNDILTSIWRENKPLKNEEHPTIKPVALIERAIYNSSKRNDIVLDIFGGSGSTIIACEKVKRRCFMMEIDPYYCDVIIKRWEEYTNKKHKNINNKQGL